VYDMIQDAFFLVSIGSLDRSSPTEFLPESDMGAVTEKITKWIESPIREKDSFPRFSPRTSMPRDSSGGTSTSSSGGSAAARPLLRDQKGAPVPTAPPPLAYHHPEEYTYYTKTPSGELVPHVGYLPAPGLHGHGHGHGALGAADPGSCYLQIKPGAAPGVGAYPHPVHAPQMMEQVFVMNSEMVSDAPAALPRLARSSSGQELTSSGMVASNGFAPLAISSTPCIAHHRLPLPPFDASAPGRSSSSDPVVVLGYPLALAPGVGVGLPQPHPRGHPHPGHCHPHGHGHPHGHPHAHARDPHMAAAYGGAHAHSYPPGAWLSSSGVEAVVGGRPPHQHQHQHAHPFEFKQPLATAAPPLPPPAYHASAVETSRVLSAVVTSRAYASSTAHFTGPPQPPVSR
jgi:hypothetical protein